MEFYTVEMKTHFFPRGKWPSGDLHRAAVVHTYVFSRLEPEGPYRCEWFACTCIIYIYTRSCPYFTFSSPRIVLPRSVRGVDDRNPWSGKVCRRGISGHGKGLSWFFSFRFSIPRPISHGCRQSNYAYYVSLLCCYLYITNTYLSYKRIFIQVFSLRSSSKEPNTYRVYLSYAVSGFETLG